MIADTLTLRVEKLSSNGEGIAFSEGKAVFFESRNNEKRLAEYDFKYRDKVRH